MKWKLLKKARVLVSLAFFLAIAFLFLDLSFSIPARFADDILFFQLIPSFLKFLSGGILSAAGFLFVMSLTLLFGRVYCSFLCPLGVFQDFFSRAGHKRKKSKYAYARPHTKTWYGILAGVGLLFIAGSVIGLNLLDPYSNFGRIMAQLVRPIAVWMNNTLVFVLEKINVYSLHPLDLKGMAVFPILFAAMVSGVIAWMSFFHGRLYCNTICPVGAFLGLLSRFSLFKIRFIPSACVSCGACEKICKSNCMDMKTHSIDFSRCVACYNCLRVCPASGINYQWAWAPGGSEKALHDPDKRAFIMQSAALLTVSGSIASAMEPSAAGYEDSLVPVMGKGPVSPPGSISLENFTSRCTACHLCVTACPTRVLQPAFFAYGLSGTLQPRMDFKTGFCNYDCTVCSSVCPTGAIVPRNLEEKKAIQPGIARFIQENCVVYIRKTDCGACAEHCPTAAVRMIPDPRIQKRAPKIDERICVGCGACEFACPTKPYKAIYVETNPVHRVAEKPEEKKIADTMDVKEDFPF
jgi:ferredoxin